MIGVDIKTPRTFCLVYWLKRWWRDIQLPYCSNLLAGAYNKSLRVDNLTPEGCILEHW